MAYEEEEFLELSGLQHFDFCRRQWALIHIEGQWEENSRTLQGRILHENAHDASRTEKRGDLLIVRGLPVFSRSLGVSGVCDVVEFRASSDGVTLFGREGSWLPRPVEYKRGVSKKIDADRLQLCCQAICLEEMLLCPPIEEAYLYYGESRRREAVALNAELRSRVASLTAEMHELTRRQYTPKVKPSKSCNACSLKERCLPALYGRTGSALEYLSARLEEEP